MTGCSWQGAGRQLMETQDTTKSKYTALPEIVSNIAHAFRVKQVFYNILKNLAKNKLVSDKHSDFEKGKFTHCQTYRYPFNDQS
jgi:hexokinase